MVVGFAGGDIERVALNRVMLKNISIIGLHWGAYDLYEKETIGKVWDGIFDMIEDGLLKSITFKDQKFQSLKAVPRALRAFEERETWGKVVIEIGEHEGEEGNTEV